MHGGDIYTFQKEVGKCPLDFSENTNPYMLPEGVKEAIVNGVSRYNVYPDPQCRELSEAVGTYYNVEANHLLFGNGAADLIFKIAYALRPKKALLLAPTFSEYELSLRNIGTEISYFSIRPERNFIISKEILKSICGNDIVYICNPNNPTGKICSREIMSEILGECKKNGAYLVVDECFMDFVDDSSSYSLIDEVRREEFGYDKLIILKAFTKLFAMAGLRLGFCVSTNEELLNQINHAGQPWSVSTVAQVAGVACCKESKYVKESLAEIGKERIYLICELRRLEFQVWESDANYILFRSEIDLIQPLQVLGIMIRSCKDYVNLDAQYYRIGVKRHLDNVRFIQALELIKKGR